MRRNARRLSLVATVIALAGTAGIALAGGWSVATLHPIATAPVAGEPTTIGYTIRQHGRTPVRVDGTGIEVVAPDGTVTLHPGTPLARDGRYAATVTFPRAGTWRWRALKGWFGRQDLGSITVQAKTAAPRPRALDGRALFLAKGCGVCHFGPDTEAQVDVGPSLRGLSDRFRGKAGLQYIRQSIRKPNAVVATSSSATFGLMPLLEVTDAEADAIARYLLRK